MNATDLPGLNATLNFISTVFLTLGYVNVKRNRPDVHKTCMVAALISSCLFLISYVIYHYQVGSVPYPHFDWTRPVYFAILIPHIILAALMAPFIVAAVRFAIRGDFKKHTMITRFLWPVWMFVSLSGIVVYFMLYHL